MNQRVEHVQLMMEKLPTTESRKRLLVVLDEKIYGGVNVVYEFEHRPCTWL
jgi:glutamine synthetase type III